MKKKGLIISTIVMVLVLAASLTTATYAWFTTTAQNEITAISFSVSSGSDVVIGLKTDNNYEANPAPGAFTSGSTTIASSYATGDPVVVNGNIPSAGDTYWTGGAQGLGNNINTNLDLSGMEKAVGTGKPLSTADTSFDYSAIRSIASKDGEGTTGMIMANGNGTASTADTAERAYAQRDYLDVVIGVKADAADLYKIFCNVTVIPDSGNPQLGLNAAIHVAWAINGMIDESTPSDQKVDLYGENRYFTTLADVTGAATGNMTQFGGVDRAITAGAINKQITVAQSSTATGTDYMGTNTIYQIHLLIWIDGIDNDCVKQGLGVASEILINFSTDHAPRG